MPGQGQVKGKKRFHMLGPWGRLHGPQKSSKSPKVLLYAQGRYRMSTKVKLKRQGQSH